MNISMQEKETLAYFVSGVLPVLIAVFQQPTWSDRKRTLFALAFVWGVVFLWWLYMWISEASLGALTLTVPVVLQLGRMLLGSLVVALTTYRGIWKQTGVAQRVEAATTPDKTDAQIDAKDALLDEAKRKETPPFTSEA